MLGTIKTRHVRQRQRQRNHRRPVSGVRACPTARQRHNVRGCTAGGCRRESRQVSQQICAPVRGSCLGGRCESRCWYVAAVCLLHNTCNSVRLWAAHKYLLPNRCDASLSQKHRQNQRRRTLTSNARGKHLRFFFRRVVRLPTRNKKREPSSAMRLQTLESSPLMREKDTE